MRRKRGSRVIHVSGHVMWRRNAHAVRVRGQRGVSVGRGSRRPQMRGRSQTMESKITESLPRRRIALNFNLIGLNDVLSDWIRSHHRNSIHPTQLVHLLMLFLHLFHEDVFLLILAPFILEPDANNPGTESGHLHELLLHESVGPRVCVVART